MNSKLATTRQTERNPFEVGPLGGIVGEITEQLLGEKITPRNSGELAQNQELNILDLLRNAIAPDKQQPKTSKVTASEKLTAHVEPGINYQREIVTLTERKTHEDTQELKTKLEEIQIELRRITDSSKELQIEFKEVVGEEQRIEKPGQYHLNFFEWVLSVIRTVRLRVEDSASWLAVFKSKKNHKDYWSQFKKHGTSFGLNNERTVSTQTG